MQSASVGTVLRKARVSQGIPLDVAARDTRIRPDVLEGLEDGRFDRMAGQVHVRGTLRTYARYLGLPEDALLERFRDAGGSPEEAPPPPPLAEIMPVLRRRQTRIVAVAAIAALGLALGFGVLRVGADTPPAADLATDAVPSVAPIRGGILLAITARVPVEVGIRIDGGAEATYDLIAGESRSFEADGMLELRLGQGGTADVVVNGVALGAPGNPDGPWERTFRPGDKVLTPQTDASPTPAAS
jgi:hypothetical protein